MEDTTLSRSNIKILGGVCSGIADYIGWDKGLVRVIYILLSLFTFIIPGIIVYIYLWIKMPSKSELGTSGKLNS